MRHGATVLARGFGLVLALAAVLVGAATTGCPQHPPPTPAGVDASVAPLPGPSAATLPAPSAGLAAAAASGATPDPSAATADTSGAAAASASAARAAAMIDAGDPGALAQTHDKPSPSSPPLEARAAALWDGIVHDDPDRAMPFFFPVSAYAQVKAIAFPASDWRRRLVAAFTRDIHGLAKRLGDKAASAKFVRLDVPDERARWVEPDEESNKLGYFRVYGTRLVYELDGKEKSFEISSLISWRGEWYVVHLTGFK